MSRWLVLVVAGLLVLVLLAMTRDPVPPDCPWDPDCAVRYQEEP